MRTINSLTEPDAISTTITTTIKNSSSTNINRGEINHLRFVPQDTATMLGHLYYYHYDKRYNDKVLFRNGA
jgi:hypothetical protein